MSSFNLYLAGSIAILGNACLHILQAGPAARLVTCQNSDLAPFPLFSVRSAMTAKTYDIRPNQSVELLKELHILTRDGKMNQDSRRKLKQVYHLFQFIEPLLADVLGHHAEISVVDHGAGKSYLGFILYDLFFKEHAPLGRI